MDKKWKTAAIACLCTVAVLSVSFSAVTLARLKKLESNLSQVQNSVTSIDSDINSTLNTAITTITQTAEKQASIVSDYKVVWGECSQKEKTMQMTVRIMPKEFSDDTQVRVRYSGYSLKGEGYDMVFDTEGFDEQSASAARVESGVYEANITIPLVDCVTLSAEVQEGQTVRQEKLEDQYTAWGLELLHPQMEGGFDYYKASASDKTSIDYGAYANIDLMNSYDAGGVMRGPKMTGASVSLYLNGEELLTRQLGEATEEGQPTISYKQEDGSVKKVYNNEEPGSYLWNGQIQNLKEDDVISMVMRAQDENGFTYEQEVSRWTVSIKDGWIQTRDETSGGILIK